MSTAINRFSIPLPGECIMEGQQLELKYCEQCGIAFVRKLSPTIAVLHKENVYHGFHGTYSGKETVERRKATGERYCGRCKARALQPDIEAQERYKEMLTKEQVQRHSHHLPKYDRSLEPKLEYHPKPKTVIWHNAVRAAMALRGSLTLEAICAVIPNCYTPIDAAKRCKATGLILVRVARMPRVPGQQGQAPGLYVIGGTIQ